MPCLHWYSQIVHALADCGFLDVFISDEYLLTDAQMGFSLDESIFVDGSNLPSDSGSETESESDDDASLVSPLGFDHNTQFKQMLIKVSVNALDRRLNEGTTFEKKKKHEEMIRRVSRCELAKIHSEIKGEDSVKDAFAFLYMKILRQQIPAAIWMALAPFSPSSHESIQPYPSSMVLCTKDSLTDSWFFSSTFYRNSKAGEKLTEHEKEACQTLSLFFNSGTVPHKSEKNIIALVRKNSNNIAKLFRAISKQYPTFDAPVPADHAFNVCWRGKLEKWSQTPSQVKHMRLMCSLFPGQTPSRMSHVACCIMESLIKIPSATWDSISRSCKDVMAGNFYFARFCGTPPPGPKSLNDVFQLWGNVESACTPSVSETAVSSANRSSACVSMICAAHTLVELLRESFRRRPPPLSHDEMNTVFRHWDDPDKLATDANITACRRVFRVLRRLTYENQSNTRYFRRKTFPQRNYIKSFRALYKLWDSKPNVFVVIFMFSRVLSTCKSLELRHLLQNECCCYSADTSKNNTKSQDHAVVAGLASYESLFQAKPRQTTKGKNA